MTSSVQLNSIFEITMAWMTDNLYSCSYIVHSVVPEKLYTAIKDRFSLDQSLVAHRSPGSQHFLRLITEICRSIIAHFRPVQLYFLF